MARWSVSGNSTGISSGAIGVQPAQGQQKKLLLLGFTWAIGASMASTGYFRCIGDGSTIIPDVAGARLSGYLADETNGLAEASSWVFNFSASAAGGAANSFFAWGRYA